MKVTMREIKFRAKDCIGGWRYGFVTIMKGNEEAEITPVWEDGTVHPYIRICVIPETIGQYTGLHDLNGVEIYEGDIVNMRRTPDGRRMRVTARHVVTCDNVTEWSFQTLANEVSSSFSMSNFHEKYSVVNHHVEVIGNIYDNPELAKPYSLNLPAPRQRKKRNKGFQVEFVVSDTPKSEPHVEDNRIVYEVTQEEMDEAIRSQLKRSE